MPTPQVSFKLSELGVAPVIEGAVPGWEPLQTDAFRATAGPSLTVHRRIETANPGANPTLSPTPTPTPTPTLTLTPSLTLTLTRAGAEEEARLVRHETAVVTEEARLQVSPYYTP